MSWIIGQYLKELPYIKERADINSDEYNNTLMIEKTLKDMFDKGLISDFEVGVIDAIISGYNFSEISRLLNADRQRVSQTFKKITDRIAYIMGGEFTDAAFLETVQDLEMLSDQDMVELLQKGITRIID